MEANHPFFDGNWVDLTSIVIGIAFAFWRARPLRPFNLPVFALATINGIGVFPIVLLCCGVFSTKLLMELVHSSRLTLFIAGLFSLVALFRAPDTQTSPAAAPPAPSGP